MRTILVQHDQNQTSNMSNQEMLEKIEKLRQEMYQHYEGHTNKQEVVTVSQELDKLIYQYIATSKNGNRYYPE